MKTGKFKVLCIWDFQKDIFSKNVSKNSPYWSWRSSNPFIALLCRKWLGKSFEEKIFGRGWEEFPYKSKFHIFLESLFQREGIVLIKMPQKLKREEQRGLLSVLPTFRIFNWILLETWLYIRSSQIGGYQLRSLLSHNPNLNYL